MEPVKIWVYPTFIALKVQPNGLVDGTSYSVHRFICRHLTEWEYNPRIRREVAVRKYTNYDFEQRLGKLPRHTLKPLTDEMDLCGVRYEIVHVEVPTGDPLGIQTRPGVEDRDYQTPIIDFLVNSDKPIRPLSQQTGDGKTYCAIKAAVRLDRKAFVLTSGLTAQWKKSFVQFTDIDPDEVYLLQGFKSIADLIQSDFRPKVLIGSTQTIRAYCQREEAYAALPPIHQFLEAFGIGVKIVDECHMNFFANTQIDLQCQVPVNIYLSATYLRTDACGLRIFNTIFPKSERYGEGNYKKYVNISFYSYDVGYIAEDKDIHTMKGYSHNLYESKMLVDRDTRKEFGQVVAQLVRNHFLTLRSPGQKMLILMNTIRGVEMLMGELATHFPELTIKEYIHGSPDTHLGEGVDIIVSTPKSCGTGRDIKNLRTCLLTVSMSSEVQTKQILGRLRALPSGETPEMVDMYNRRYGSHVRHYERRSCLYRQLGLTYQEFSI